MTTIVNNDRGPRISWGAIFAGVSLSLVSYLILSVLGTAIGAGAIDPLEEGNPVRGMGMGTGIWLLLTTVISIAIGAYFAGRSSRTQGSLHGVLSWAITTMLTIYLLTSIAGGIFGAAGSILGKGLSIAGEGAMRAAPAVADTVKDQMRKSGVDIDMGSIQSELDTLLRQSGKAELNPERLQDNAQQAAQDGQNTAQGAAQQPQNADNDMAAWWNRVKSQAAPALNAADKEALVNIIQARTGKSREESQRIADNYERTYNQTMAKIEEAKKQAEQKAREAADATARAVSQGAWWTLATLIIGMLIAGAAGAAGFKRRPLAYRDDVVAGGPTVVRP
ncbi:hypothetical protein GCM10007242_46130 [Pigmentiphaga litoralis]|uniref:hypothetical protein n=1 Tax=Pigmentiphaga litoralis TaxID=516702 RepID=UPI0016772C7E|nr:hypothetical protein [Pigmentiphaga litoralis]GGX33671.1 hypothetical protein GCM10007242_46130 [Pigmentiphaga litoralis]